MKINRTHYIAPKECPFTLNGENLASLRRAKLNKIANAIKVETKDSGNATLGLVIVRLKALGANPEIGDLL